MAEELPFHLKDIHYKIIGEPRIEKMTDEWPEEVKQKRIQFESAWNHLKNAMALVYDGVYSENELDFAGMRAEVKQLHDELNELGYPITDLTE